MIVCELGVAEIVKSGGAGAWTTSVAVAVCVSVPLVPVTVSVDVLAGVLEAVDTVIVELDTGGLTEVGLNVAVAPAGRPLAVNVTMPLNPLEGVTVTV